MIITTRTTQNLNNHARKLLIYAEAKPNETKSWFRGLLTGQETVWASCWGEPNHITWAFVGFSRSRLAFSQASMSTRHAVRCATATAVSASLAEVLTLTCMSTAYWCRLRPWRATKRPNTAVWKRYSSVVPVWILAEPQTAPAAQQIVDHCRQSAAFCQWEMTAPSQGLNQTDQQQTAGDPEAWSGQCSRKLLRGPTIPAVLLTCSH